jgi:hypothetical protein
MLAIDCIYVHRRISNDRRVPGMVPVARGVHVLSGEGIPES